MIPKMKKVRWMLSALLLFVLSGCDSTETKMKKFVNEFNVEAGKHSNDFLKLAYANITSKKKITIYFVTKLETDDPGNTMAKGFIPQLSAEMLKEVKQTSALLKDGVSFEIVLQSNNKTVLSRTNLDLNKYNEILAENAKTMSESGAAGGSELEKMLAILNKSLPVTDPSTGIIIQKVLVESKTLVYVGIIPDALVENFKSPEAKELVKQGIMESSNLTSVLQEMNKFGIRSLAYRYTTKDGAPVLEIPLTAADLMKSGK